MATQQPISVVTIRDVVLPDAKPHGAMAMRGFARRFRTARRSQEWMAELREGES